MRLEYGFGWLRWMGVLAIVPVSGVALHLASCVSSDTGNLTCINYCGDIMKTCTGDDQQYPDEGTCERVCAAMAPGAQGQGGSDTVACRMLNVSSAKDAPTAAEKHGDCVAGGVAASSCGSGGQCEAFCALDVALCSGPDSVYDGGVAQCQAACATWGASFDGGLLSSPAGNTLECRTYHLLLSQTGQASDLTTHCPHTSANSARCIDTPEAGSDAGAPDASADAPID